MQLDPTSVPSEIITPSPITLFSPITTLFSISTFFPITAPFFKIALFAISDFIFLSTLPGEIKFKI